MSDKQGMWKSIFTGLKNMFVEDETEESRFPDMKSVGDFLGLDDDFTIRHKGGKELVERWFFITNRKDLMKTNSTVEDRYTEMVGHFNLLVDSLFIIQNNKDEKSEAKDKSAKYVAEFKKLLDAFESFVYNSVAQKIDSERNVRAKVQVYLENE